MAAPAFRAAASGTGVLPNIVVGRPTGTADGDLLLAVVSFYMADSSKNVTTVPAGWTLLRTLDNFAQSNHRTSVYWKIAASEPTTWTFGTNATVAHGHAWGCIAIQSPVGPTYITAHSGQIDPNTAPTSHTAPSVTTGSATDMLVYVCGGRGAITALTPPSGYTERVDVYEGAVANNLVEIATKAAAGAAGATGTVSGTDSLGGADMENILIAVNGAAVAAPPSDPPGISIAFTDNWDVASPTWTRIDNVAGRRVRGYTIDRGRPNEFEKTGTGTATIRLTDRIGTFDPTDPVALTTVAPGKQANISLWNPVNSTWHTIFRGYVESWRYVLDQTRQYTEIELTLTDGFAILSRYELVPLRDGYIPGPPPYTSPPYATVAEAEREEVLAGFAKGNVLYGETVSVSGSPTAGTVGDRILSILGDAGWPAALSTNWVSPPAGTIPDVFSGNVRVGPKAYASGTSALDALFDAADGEFPGVANLYMAANGHVRFRGRQARFRPAVAQYGITPWLVGDPSAWSDATCVPLAELEWSHGEDNLYNSCTATPQGVGSGLAWRPYNPDPPHNDNPATQTATAPTSIATHGLRGLTFDNLQTIEGKATSNSSKVETALFASYYVQNYASPNPRISRAVFKTRLPANTHAGKLWEFLCNVEISDLLTVKTDHPGAGGFNQDFYVEGIHYTVRPGPPEFAIVELSLDISPRAHYTTNPFTTDPDPA
jgi:hypothetical protein